MDKIVPQLLRAYRQKTVTPVIVEAKLGMFDQVSTRLKSIVPITPFSRISTLLPRIMPSIEPFTMYKEIPSFNMIATMLTPDLIEEIAQQSEVKRVYLDFIKYALQTVPVEGIFKNYKKVSCTSTYWTKNLLGLDRANKQGFTGNGITAAVIDTGARASHSMLRGRVTTYTAIPEKGGTGMDSDGHGTWCNSTVGGRSDVDSHYAAKVEGMAPDCSLISIQALGFILGMGSSSDIIKGMEMSISLGAKVVSMSLGSNDAPTDADNPEATAIDGLVAHGIIPCIAAGNSGPNSSTVGSPGCCKNSLTVGAWDAIQGAIADFSSRGPTSGDNYVKPDVITPGVNIDSALIGYLDALVDPTDTRYGAISGTSMATPHTAGLVTCMAQLYREKVGQELTVNEVKAMMEALGNSKDNNVGWGLLSWNLVEQWVSTQYGISL